MFLKGLPDLELFEKSNSKDMSPGVFISNAPLKRINYLYKLYARNIMPVIGSFISKDKSAYKYLYLSAKAFPFGKAFNKILEKNGFIVIKNIPQGFGVALIYHAYKPVLNV